MTTSISNAKAAKAFDAIVESIGRMELAGILFNWNESELSDDGDKIIHYVGRDRQYSRGALGGKSRVKKADFLTWLLSDAPFDTSVYGQSISADAEWRSAINAARMASGLWGQGDVHAEP